MLYSGHQLVEQVLYSARCTGQDWTDFLYVCSVVFLLTQRGWCIVPWVLLCGAEWRSMTQTTRLVAQQFLVRMLSQGGCPMLSLDYNALVIRIY